MLNIKLKTAFSLLKQILRRTVDLVILHLL